MAWQGDLEGGGGRPEGVNFWLSPLGIPLAGTEKACREVEQLLKKAGFRVYGAKNRILRMQASVTAVMTAFVAGLELSGWSLGNLSKKLLAQAGGRRLPRGGPGPASADRRFHAGAAGDPCSIDDVPSCHLFPAPCFSLSILKSISSSITRRPGSKPSPCWIFSQRTEKGAAFRWKISRASFRGSSILPELFLDGTGK